MDNRFKRPNRRTGKPFEPGFQDENGRVFLRYLNKHFRAKRISFKLWDPSSIITSKNSFFPFFIIFLI